MTEMMLAVLTKLLDPAVGTDLKRWVRYGITSCALWFAQRGIVDMEQAAPLLDTLVNFALAALSLFGPIWISKLTRIKDERDKDIALALGKGATRDDIKRVEAKVVALTAIEKIDEAEAIRKATGPGTQPLPPIPPHDFEPLNGGQP